MALRRNSTRWVSTRDPRGWVYYIGIHALLSNTRNLEILKYSGANLLLQYGKYDFYHNAMQNARFEPVKGGTRRSDAKQVSSAFFNRTLQQSAVTARAHNPKALGEENFPHRKVDFAKDIAKSLTRQYKSRSTSEMSNATVVQALGRRK